MSAHVGCHWIFCAESPDRIRNMRSVKKLQKLNAAPNGHWSVTQYVHQCNPPNVHTAAHHLVSHPCTTHTRGLFAPGEDSVLHMEDSAAMHPLPNKASFLDLLRQQRDARRSDAADPASAAS
eukprot:m.1354069 g.1354069  ORF g.1354069 m.1354069 type:complete len:122 (-) comp24931_c1_seq16:2368-2733(-)